MNRTVKERVSHPKKQPINIMELIRTVAVLIMVPVQIGILLHSFGVI